LTGCTPLQETASTLDQIPSTLAQKDAMRFWIAVLLTGLGAGVGAVVLTLILARAQHFFWPGPGTLEEAAAGAGAGRHVVVLLAAGVLAGAGQLILVRLPSGNGIDITQAIWFSAGRLPTMRTLGSATLSVILVGMGASLGREGAPKQAGAVVANVLADCTRMSDEQRRLLVACGAGAGMAAAYGVPLGGALFALEVLRGVLALRLVIPALLASLIATVVSWVALPDAPTYVLPAYATSTSIMVWAIVAGPIIGLVSVAYVRMVAWADRNKPEGRLRLLAPTLGLGALGLASIAFPQLLGNGKDIAQQTISGETEPALLIALLLLKPAAILICLGCGVPGGLFTPTLAVGALLGAVLGSAWAWLWPGAPPGLFAIVGAAAMLAATTQGPISAVVLMIELTGRDRSFIAPLVLAVAIATLVARTIEPRSIYDARLTDDEVIARQKSREISPR
jgi:CIC family chloride channel protein